MAATLALTSRARVPSYAIRRENPAGIWPGGEDLTKANVAHKAAAGLARIGEPFADESGRQAEIVRRSCGARMGFMVIAGGSQLPVMSLLPPTGFAGCDARGGRQGLKGMRERRLAAAEDNVAGAHSSRRQEAPDYTQAAKNATGAPQPLTARATPRRPRHWRRLR